MHTSISCFEVLKENQQIFSKLRKTITRIDKIKDTKNSCFEIWKANNRLFEIMGNYHQIFRNYGDQTVLFGSLGELYLPAFESYAKSPPDCSQ